MEIIGVLTLYLLIYFRKTGKLKIYKIKRQFKIVLYISLYLSFSIKL